MTGRQVENTVWLLWAVWDGMSGQHLQTQTVDFGDLHRIVWGLSTGK